MYPNNVRRTHETDSRKSSLAPAPLPRPTAEPGHPLSGRLDDLRHVRVADRVAAGRVRRPAVHAHRRRRRRPARGTVAALHAADQRLGRVPVGRHVLRGGRRAGQRAAAPHGHAHAVGARAQPRGRRAGGRQPALGRRAAVPGGAQDRHRRRAARHVRRVAARAAGQEVRAPRRAGPGGQGVRPRVRRDGRPDGQQRVRRGHTAVRQLHVRRDAQVGARRFYPRRRRRTYGRFLRFLNNCVSYDITTVQGPDTSALAKKKIIIK